MLSVFKGQSVPSNTGVLEYTKCLSAQICRNNSRSFEDMRSNVFQLPEDIIHHLHFESRDREKCKNSRMFCSVCSKRGRKIDGERSRRPPGTHIWWVYKHKTTLLFMALWLVVTSNGSTEIILSSCSFMHSQTQSQPQHKVVDQQFLFLDINYEYVIVDSFNKFQPERL